MMRSAAAGLVLSFTAACVTAPTAPEPALPPKKAETAAPLATEPRPSVIPAPPTAVSTPTCPEGMALVPRMQGVYCIDRYEASLDRVTKSGERKPHPFNQKIDGFEREVVAVSVAGRKPQGYISGEQATIACENSGKRLCETDEWVRACRGPKLSRYPYGNVRKAGMCNDRFKVLDHHPVPILWKKDPESDDPKRMWHPSFMNDPRLLEMGHTIVASGTFTHCTNDYGVYDMVGNLHEWVADPEGTFRGGFFMDTFQNGEGCDYRTRGHPFDYHDYSTGFRCCADPKLSS